MDSVNAGTFTFLSCLFCSLLVILQYRTQDRLRNKRNILLNRAKNTISFLEKGDMVELSADYSTWCSRTRDDFGKVSRTYTHIGGWWLVVSTPNNFALCEMYNHERGLWANLNPTGCVVSYVPISPDKKGFV